MNTLHDLLVQIPGFELFTTVADIAIVFYLVYRLLVMFKGTRATQILWGLLLVLLLFFVSREEFLNLTTLNWILDKFVSSFILILIVVFQPDIRRALSEMGKNPLFRTTGKGDGAIMYEEVIKAAFKMAMKRIGALIVLEREADLKPYTEDAVEIDARVTSSTLCAIFVPSAENPLHDGAVIIRRGRISHAGCFLPLTENPRVDRTLGTRHRAAIGLTEVTDAAVIVVSEETGIVSLAYMGNLRRGLDENGLRKALKELFGPRREESTQ